jgi:hypothetical protein
MNHVLHPMLMGLGREGSISIAYLILLSGRDRIPLGCAFGTVAGWRSRIGPGAEGPCPGAASMPGRTMHSMHYGVTSVPVPHPCARRRFGMELDIST